MRVRSLTMASIMDIDLGPRADELRLELRGLIREHIPPDYLGAFTHDPADLEIAQRFCGLLAERGLLCLT